MVGKYRKKTYIEFKPFREFKDSLKGVLLRVGNKLASQVFTILCISKAKTTECPQWWQE